VTVRFGVAASSPGCNHLCTPARCREIDNEGMVTALAYPVQILGVLSAVLVWMVVVPIVDLLTPGLPEAA
jgi:hypothetical protein